MSISLISRVVVFGFVALLAMAKDPVPEKTIENGLNPSGKKLTLTLEEELRLGPEDGGEEMIWSGQETRVTVNSKGQMFVVDNRENRILAFNPDGTFDKQIGKQGPGPGEFNGLNSLTILNDDSAIAFTNMMITSQFHTFNDKMEFQDVQTLNGMDKIYQEIRFSPSGKFFSGIKVSIKQETGKMEIHGIIGDKDFNVVQDLSNFENMIPGPAIIGDPELFSDFMANNFKRGLNGEVGFATFSQDGTAYTAMGKEYKITVWSPDLQKSMVITREYKPILRSEEETQALVEPIREAMMARMPPQLHNLLSASSIKRALDKADLNPSKPPVNGILPMEDGYFIVIHDVSLVKHKSVADIFDKEGKLRGHFEFDERALSKLVFRNGKAYTIETNEDEDNFLVRYKYTLSGK